MCFLFRKNTSLPNPEFKKCLPVICGGSGENPLPPLPFWGINMKHINVKRVFLNIGLTLAVIALFFLCWQIYDNSFLVKTTGTVQAVREPEYSCNYVDADGNEHPMMEYDVFYTVRSGESYTDYIMGHIDEYSIGEAVDVIYDKRRPDRITYLTDNMFYIIVFGVPAVLLIYFCRSAFKGYKTEYLDRYKKTVIFSVITGWIPILYYIWYEFFFEPSGMMFSGLGEGLMCLFLFAAVPVINIIVWIISAVVYCHKCKKNEGSVDENGSA